MTVNENKAGALRRLDNVVEDDELLSMGPVADGRFYLAEDVDARIAAFEQQVRDWEATYRSANETYLDIGRILGAVLPAELVTEVARQRMERIAVLEAENIELRRRPSADTLNATARRLIAELNDDDDCDEDCKNCQARGMGYLHSELLQHLAGAATAPNEETKGATPCAGSN